MTPEEFYHQVSRDQLTALCRRSSTPVYIYAAQMVRDRISHLKRSLGDRFEIHFAVKANPHPQLLEIMAAAGLGADVASLNELRAALDAGIAPHTIDFSGPGKTVGELAEAARWQIGAINAESLQELGHLARLARQQSRSIRTGLRLNPGFRGVQRGLMMAGDTPFGILEEDCGAAFAFLRDHADRLPFAGLHVHVGSQILDEEAIVTDMRSVLDMTLALESRYGIQVPRINFGGGWGVDYFPEQAKLDVMAIAEDLEDLLETAPYGELARRTTFILEPGRFLVAESGVYATQVLYRKRGRSKDYIVVDGGMHQNMLAAGGLGQVVRRNFEMAILPHPDLPPPDKQPLCLDVVGRLCTPQDVLAVEFDWPVDVRPDDFVIFFNSGAYGLTASPVQFLSHPLPGQQII